MFVSDGCVQPVNPRGAAAIEGRSCDLAVAPLHRHNGMSAEVLQCNVRFGWKADVDIDEQRLNFARAMIAVEVPTPVCVSHAPQGQWRTGHFEVAPVSAVLPVELARAIDAGALKPITSQLAQTLTGDSKLPVAKYHYLTRAAFYGNEGTIDRLPRGVAVSLDVQANGVGYLQSYRLTAQTKLSSAPVVLISDARLSGVITVCGAAL